MDQGKSLLASKTFWLNIMGGAIGVAMTLSDSPLANDPRVKAGLVAFVSIGNIILRLVTKQEIVSVLPKPQQ